MPLAFAATGAQARRAKFIADVLLGQAKRTELVAGVKKKRLKDFVRLLGLLPLSIKAAAPNARPIWPSVTACFRIIVATPARCPARCRNLDARLRAVEIGMQNLAATADYPDPLRLEWAMEADTVRDLVSGSITVKKGDVAVNTLAFDERFEPQLSVARDGKPLKAIPPAVKKEKSIASLVERLGELRKQTARVRWSLETAMCRGDEISGAELAQLADHAILAPLLQRLVLIGDGAIGYLDRKGKALRDHAGARQVIKKGARYRIAHPADLLATKDWPAWQHECFRAERLQPFKQVFRELYVVTKQEAADASGSSRYAGQQINEKQAFALWGQRGWHTQEGVFKVFHHEAITASVEFRYGGGTPMEVEGLTVDMIGFHRHDEYKPLKLPEVPARVFSEVMRDIDLVVSVAHRGGVDPEASASTVEMRASLTRETCALLGLANVRVKPPHVIIDGKLNQYSLHLGSANVSRMPGGAVCIIPVHAQHRGRIFLPFADNDPKTAEGDLESTLLGRDGGDPGSLADPRAACA